MNWFKIKLTLLVLLLTIVFTTELGASVNDFNHQDKEVISKRTGEPG